MANISYNELTYGNKKYAIFANIFNINGRPIETITDRLNIELSTISYLEIMSSLTSPVLTGKLIFTVQNNNPFQVYLKELYTYLEIDIGEYDSFEHISDRQSSATDIRISFNHIFLITKVKTSILQRKYIQYSLDFISSDIWNIENKIYVSTGGDSRPIIELMSTAFSTAGLSLSTSAIEKYSKDGGVNKSISYTSTANDNLNSIITYFQKQLLNPKLESPESSINCESLVSYVYNHINNRYHLWNLDCIYQALTVATEKYNTNKSIDTIAAYIGNTPFISNNDPDLTIGQYPSSTRLNTAKALSTYNTYEFDFSTNIFKPIKVENNVKRNIIESQWLNANTSEVFSEKYKPITYKDYPQYNLDLVLDEYHSPSDSHQSLYKTLINILLGNDAILIKTACKIDRFPGTVVYLNIDETSSEYEIDKNSSETNVQFDTRIKWKKLQTLNGFYTIVGNSMVFEYNEITNTPMFRNYLHINRPVNIK